MSLLKKGTNVVYVDRRDDRHDGVVVVPNTKASPDYVTIKIDDGVTDGPRDVYVPVLSLENPIQADPQEEDDE